MQRMQEAQLGCELADLFIPTPQSLYSAKWRKATDRVSKWPVASLRALTICMENPEIPERIQMERFIPVEIFQ